MIKPTTPFLKNNSDAARFSGFSNSESAESPVVIGPPVRFANRVSRLLVVRESHIIPERRSWSNVTITVISGDCRIDLESESILIAAGDSFNIPANAEHRISGISNLRAVISFDAIPGPILPTQDSNLSQVAI